MIASSKLVWYRVTVMPDDRNALMGADRLPHADAIRVLAISLIVVGHYAGNFLYRWNEVSTTNWFIASFYDIFPVISVPVLVMLSGSLLLAKDEPYPTFFRKRVRRLVVPFIIWTVVFVLWRIFYLDEALSVRIVIEDIVGGQVYYHLWFIPMLLCLYAITPLLRGFMRGMGKLDIRYFALLWVVAISIIPFLEFMTAFSLNETLPTDLGRMGSGIVAWTIAFAGYYVLGSWLASRQFSRMELSLAWATLVIAFLSIVVGTYLLSLNSGQSELVLFRFMTPTLMATAVSTFVLLNHYGRRLHSSISPRVKRGLSTFSLASLGVYLVHPIFLELLENGDLGFVLSATAFNPLLAIPVSAAAAITLSAIFSFLIMRIPILKYSIG